MKLTFKSHQIEDFMSLYTICTFLYKIKGKNVELLISENSFPNLSRYIVFNI